MNRWKRPLQWVAVAIASLVIGSVGLAPLPASAAPTPGAVYTLSNSATGNSVLIFNRAADGSLAYSGSVATGGLGSGTGLGSQGAVVLARSGRWLFAVNAG